MSVMIVTSLGDLVIDLFTDDCLLTTKNFIKLCKIKYYNGCLFHTVQKDFTAQTGDPTGTGSGGDSIFKLLYGEQARFFGDEIRPNLKHSKMGTVAMASAGENQNASQFYITLRDGLDYLDEKHTVFGEVVEGHDTLLRINEAYVDEKGRPFKNIRIKHTHVLDDPFDDPEHLADLIPDASPEGKPKEEADDEVRLEDDWVPMDEQLASEELEEVIRTREAHSRAVVLESIGDIPDADVKPPENVLFVCKLNPVTEDEDLHTIFSRFGTVTSAEIIRDYKTGDSLCYAFIEFEDNDSCERAYFKMDNALIDDRRIHVDFSQSVSKLWNQFRRKGSQQGKGCFKCGALDHIARDCSGDSSLPHQKYVLKDDNKQRGGEKNAGYDMVFDEDEGSPEQAERHQGHGQDDGAKRHKSEKSGSEGRLRNHGNGESIDKNNQRYRRDDHDDRGAGRDDRGYRESRDSNRRHDRDSRERRDGGRREDRDFRERRDGGRREDGDSRERRNDGEYRKRTNDIERWEKREEPRTRERDSETDGGRSRRGEREHGRSNLKGSEYCHDDKRHARNEEPSHRRKDSHSDAQKSRREDRGNGSRSSRDYKDRDFDDKRRGERR